jgi:hypothetical protein
MDLKGPMEIFQNIIRAGISLLKIEYINILFHGYEGTICISLNAYLSVCDGASVILIKFGIFFKNKISLSFVSALFRVQCLYTS